MGLAVDALPVDPELPRVALKVVASGKFVTDEEGGAGGPQGAVGRGRGGSASEWETFALKSLGTDADGHFLIALQTIQNGRWVCAESEGGGDIHANRKEQGPWEVFTVIGDLSGQFGL